MRPFKFRAQAALDLCKRQDDDAQRDLAVTTRARILVETNVEVASATVDESMLQARQALESTAWGDLHVWHRNWIVSRKQELAVRQEALVKTRAEEQLARQRAQDARRAVRSLERWFERVQRRYQKA